MRCVSVLLCNTRKCVKKKLPDVTINKPKESPCDEPKGMEHVSHIAKTIRNSVVLIRRLTVSTYLITQQYIIEHGGLR